MAAADAEGNFEDVSVPGGRRRPAGLLYLSDGQVVVEVDYQEEK